MIKLALMVAGAMALASTAQAQENVTPWTSGQTITSAKLNQMIAGAQPSAASLSAATAPASTDGFIAFQSGGSYALETPAQIATGMGLGSAAYTASSAYDAAGAAAAIKVPVQSVAGRTGAITLTHADLTDWAATLQPYVLSSGLAQVATSGAYSSLTGLPTLGTAAAQATSAFDPAGAAAGVTINTLGAATAANLTAEVSRAKNAEAALAPLASPALTGQPTVPTAAPLTSSTVTASTAYADAAVTVETTRATQAEALRAPLASPVLTGAPTAPTAAANDNSSTVATDAYVDRAARAQGANIVLLTASSGTWTAPANVNLIYICGVGGGGGGGSVNSAISSASGGASGENACSWLAVTPGAPLSYTTGAAGAGATIGGNATAGGASTFGSLSLYGGPAGVSSTSGNAAATAVNTYATYHHAPIPTSSVLPLSDGISGGTTGVAATGGMGGTAVFGWGQGGAGSAANSAGNSATGYGNAGGGASTSTSTGYPGGAGAPGAWVIRY